MAYLKKIENLAKHMPVVLGCHCTGIGRCHAEAIKNTLEIRLKSNHDHACHRSRPGGSAYEEEHHRAG